MPVRLLRFLRRFVRRRYVIIHGFYGMGNVGDEAILAATLAAIRQAGAEPLVFAWNAERVRADFGVASLNPMHPVATVAVWAALLQARAFLLGGGGLIKDFGGSPRSLERWMKMLEAASKLGVKTMTWSVGVEPLRYPESERRVRKVLERIDAVTVRDAGSAARLRQAGLVREVLVTADPVPFLARPWRDQRRASGGLRIAVCLRHWHASRPAIDNPEVFQQCLDALAATLDHLHDRHEASLTFIPFRTAKGDDDREVAKAVQQRLRSPATIVTTPAPGVNETLGRLAEADLVIAMRLHAIIMATSIGVPSLALAYMPKVRDYMAEIGQECFCSGMQEVTALLLTTQAEAIIADRHRLSDNLLQQTGRLAEAFTRNGRILDTLLGGGPGRRYPTVTGSGH